MALIFVPLFPQGNLPYHSITATLSFTALTADLLSHLSWESEASDKKWWEYSLRTYSVLRMRSVLCLELLEENEFIRLAHRTLHPYPQKNDDGEQRMVRWFWVWKSGSRNCLGWVLKADSSLPHFTYQWLGLPLHFSPRLQEPSASVSRAVTWQEPGEWRLSSLSSYSFSRVWPNPISTCWPPVKSSSLYSAPWRHTKKFFRHQ